MGLKSSLIAVVNLTLWFTMYMFNERAKYFCESVYILYYKHNVLLHGLICSCGTCSKGIICKTTMVKTMISWCKSFPSILQK